MKKWVVGTDIGGTFTDIIGVNIETKETRKAKVPTTIPQYADGIINGLKKCGIKGEECLSLRHGATISTNAVLERKGAKTALITTEGFRDVLGGGRAERISCFELDWDPPPLIVPRRDVLGVRERIGPWGEVLVPLNEDDVRLAARKCRKRGIESIAICYMDSFMNVEHEKRTREILEEELPGVDVTVSYEIRPEMLEFERTTTTVLNAYVSPILKNYLNNLYTRLGSEWNYNDPVLVTTGSGGVMGLDEAMKLPARTFHSSPVSGAVGFAGYLGKLAGFDNIIAFETGGTTNNVSMIKNGAPALTNEWKILWNVPCCLRSVDTVYMGAGGGSIGWVDKGGMLNVGPQSQGSVPGPACYGMGGEEATNTDVQIVLGRINPDYFLGGEMKVDASLSFKALQEKVGNVYGWDAKEAAQKMYMVAMTNLMVAMRLQTVSRGWDPRDFALIPYGGGGAMYICDLAREMGATNVVVPPLPGYASAFGAIRVDVRHEFTQPVYKIESELNYDELNKQMDDLVQEGIRVLKKEGVKESDMVLRRLMDIKYFSQSRYFTVDIPAGRINDLKDATENFLKAMQAEYGYTMPPGYVPMEVVGLRIEAIGVIPKGELAPIERKGNLKDALKSPREVWFKDAGFVKTDIYEREKMPIGATFEGPAIVEQQDTTTVIPPRTRCRIDEYANILIDVLK